jgi:hypothetical protein
VLADEILDQVGVDHPERRTAVEDRARAFSRPTTRRRGMLLDYNDLSGAWEVFVYARGAPQVVTIALDPVHLVA